MSHTTDGVPPEIVRPAFAPGTVIAGRYRIEARLGAGGGGTVFRCIDQTLNLVVALKVIAPDADLERLRREVAMARQITDRNVCRVHDLGETAELRFVTMELVEGMSLRAKIDSGLPPAEARALIEQLIAGTAAIHAAGVVHRDLKPENVVVAADGRAVIVDFGLAKAPTTAAATISMRGGVAASPAVTHAGIAVGTPRYMAPEQAAGEPVDTRADVWSLGLVAHELLTGAVPARDELGHPIVSPIVVDAAWPGFAPVLRGCLTPDPGARFHDAGELGAALAALATAPPPYEPHPADTRSGATMSGRPSNAPVHESSSGPGRTSGPTPHPHRSSSATTSNQPAAPRSAHGHVAPVPDPPFEPASPSTHMPGRATQPNQPFAPASPPAPGLATRPNQPFDPASPPTPGLATPPNQAFAPVAGVTTQRRRARWPWLVAAVAASGAIGFAVVRGVRGGGPTPTSANASDTSNDISNDTPKRSGASIAMRALTTTPDAQWPARAPTSVVFDPAGTKLAYTTAGGHVLVRELAGGTPVERPAQVIVRDRPRPLLHTRVAGWFDNGDLVLAGVAVDVHHVVRLRADGTTEVLESGSWRTRVAVSPRGNKIALARREAIHDAAGARLAEIPAPDRVVALAWSPEATRLAWMRVTPKGEAILEVTGTGEVWRGRSDLLVDPLLAYAGTHIVFSFHQAGRTTIARIDPASRALSVIDELAGHVGSGSVANGTLVVVRGTVREVVQIRDRFATRVIAAHGDDTRGDHVAGWTSRGSAVYRVDDRVVVGQPGANPRTWQVDAWRGTQPTDIPIAVLGDDVLVRRGDGTDTWQVDRVATDGTRTSLGRFERAMHVRCAAGACVLQQRAGEDITWTEIDPGGNAGREIYRLRAVNASFSLSPDGATLAIVFGDDTPTLVDRATGQLVEPPRPPPIATGWAAAAFDDAGDLWVTSVPLDAHPYGLVRYRLRRASTVVMKASDALRWFAAPSVHGADTELRIAVATKELRLELYRADGL